MSPRFSLEQTGGRIRGCLHENSQRREFHTGMTLISYRVYMMTGSFHISFFEGTLHVDKIHVWFKITNITHYLLVPVYLQTDFPPERVDVSRLLDTVAKSRTGVKFSPRCVCACLCFLWKTKLQKNKVNLVKGPWLVHYNVPFSILIFFFYYYYVHVV